MVMAHEVSPERFGLLLRLARVARNLSGEEVGELFGKAGYKYGGVEKGTISVWERGDMAKVTEAMVDCAAKVFPELGRDYFEDNIDLPFSPTLCGDDKTGNQQSKDILFFAGASNACL